MSSAGSFCEGSARILEEVSELLGSRDASLSSLLSCLFSLEEFVKSSTSSGLVPLEEKTRFLQQVTEDISNIHPVLHDPNDDNEESVIQSKESRFSTQGLAGLVDISRQLQMREFELKENIYGSNKTGNELLLRLLRGVQEYQEDETPEIAAERSYDAFNEVLQEEINRVEENLKEVRNNIALAVSRM